MYKLLVVDDEPIIVDGLYERFKDLKTYPLDVYKAYSGKEAIEWLNRKKIDIVITDIKMPGIDGMQLLERIRLNWPHCRVIFLTGHDRFEYVYKAIQYSGVNYILKTEGYEIIIETVENCIKEIKDSQNDMELLQKSRLKLQNLLPALKKDYLNEVVDGTCRNVTQEQLDDLEIPLKAELPVMLAIGYIGDAPGKPVSSGQADYYKVNLAVEENMARIAYTCSTLYKNHMLWMMQIRDDLQVEWKTSASETACYIKGIMEYIQALCRETLGLQISFVISGTKAKWSNIAERFLALKAIINYARETGMEVVITDCGFEEGEVPERTDSGISSQDVRLQLKKLDKLDAYLEQGRKEEFMAAFRELRDSLKMMLENVPLFYEAFYSMSLMFLSYINRNNIYEIDGTDIAHERFTRIDRFNSPEHAMDFFEEVAVGIFEIQEAKLKKRSDAAVEKIQKYIRGNLGGDLSLSTLADMAYFNPKYLSRLFKQVTGINLSEYISEIKLDRVKGLLKQNSLKVYEIAEHVGYYSAPCFTRFFKKATAMTPQEYRESFLNENLNNR